MYVPTRRVRLSVGGFFLSQSRFQGSGDGGKDTVDGFRKVNPPKYVQQYSQDSTSILWFIIASISKMGLFLLLVVVCS